MNADIPFWLSSLFIVGGLALLAYSSNAFIDASASIARRFGISPFIVGMVSVASLQEVTPPGSVHSW